MRCCILNARKMSASNVECHKRSIDFSLLSDRKVNLVTTGGREILEAKRDVACLLRRHISTGRQGVFRGNQVPE